MILNEIKRILSKKGRASLADLSNEIDYDKEIIQDAIKHWSRKGKVKTVKLNELCSGCSSDCSSCLSKDDLILYEWIE